MNKRHTPPPPGHVLPEFAARPGESILPAIFPHDLNVIADDGRMLHFPQGIHPVPQSLWHNHHIKAAGVEFVGGTPPAPAPKPAESAVPEVTAPDGAEPAADTSRRRK